MQKSWENTLNRQTLLADFPSRSLSTLALPNKHKTFFAKHLIYLPYPLFRMRIESDLPEIGLNATQCTFLPSKMSGTTVILFADMP